MNDIISHSCGRDLYRVEGETFTDYVLAMQHAKSLEKRRIASVVVAACSGELGDYLDSPGTRSNVVGYLVIELPFSTPFDTTFL